MHSHQYFFVDHSGERPEVPAGHSAGNRVLAAVLCQSNFPRRGSPESVKAQQSRYYHAPSIHYDHDDNKHHHNHRKAIPSSARIRFGIRNRARRRRSPAREELR